MINDSPTPHFYEIITNLYKIRLYMDMEFSISQNTDMDVMQLLTSIIKIVQEKLAAGPVIVLNSSSTMKASYHLIWPNFESDNMDVLRQHVGDTLTHKSMQILRNFQKHSCIDTTPYTKYQNFRMLHCSKMGKRELLRVSLMTAERYRNLPLVDIFEYFLVCSTTRTHEKSSTQPRISRPRST